MDYLYSTDRKGYSKEEAEEAREAEAARDLEKVRETVAKQSAWEAEQERQRKTVQKIVADAAAREKAENERAMAKIRASQKSFLDQQERERVAAKKREDDAREERRKKAEAEDEALTRARFFAANPGASEDDYQSIRPALRERLLVERTIAAKTADEEAEKRMLASGF